MDQPNLNMRQQRWLDVVKNYECEILYHPDKVNMVVDSVSRILEMIKKAQTEAVNEENCKREMIVGQILAFNIDNRG